jgi:hypothetical protein
MRQMENKAAETPRASTEPDGSGVFHEVDKHLLVVSDAAAALADAEANSKARLTDASPQRAHEIMIPGQNERWGSSEPHGFDRQFFAVVIAFSVVLGLVFGGWGLYKSLSNAEQFGGATAVSTLVERIIAVESNGDPNAKNSRSSATGLGQFLDETWLDLVRAYRPDLSRVRSERETLDLRREPKLAREITLRFVERNIAMLKQRGLPVTAGTVYLAHFVGGAGAVAILSAPDNSDAALVIANADSTGRTKRARLTKANPFLEHLTVADLKVWADRKMRGPNPRLSELRVADARP